MFHCTDSFQKVVPNNKRPRQQVTVSNSGLNSYQIAHNRQQSACGVKRHITVRHHRCERELLRRRTAVGVRPATFELILITSKNINKTLTLILSSTRKKSKFFRVDVISTFKIPFNIHFGGWMVASLICLNVTAGCS